MAISYLKVTNIITNEERFFYVEEEDTYNAIFPCSAEAWGKDSEMGRYMCVTEDWTCFWNI